MKASWQKLRNVTARSTRDEITEGEKLENKENVCRIRIDVLLTIHADTVLIFILRT